MGIRLHVDLETNRGPTNELYIRIDHINFNRTVGDVKFSTTLWLNKEVGDRSLKKMADDPIQPSIGLVDPKVVYYPDEHSEGLSATFDDSYQVMLISEQEVEKKIWKTKKISHEVPYVSFDENGDEVTLYRTVEKEGRIQVGTEAVTEKIVDYTILNNIEEFCYNHVVKILSEVIPENKIEKLY